MLLFVLLAGCAIRPALESAPSLGCVAWFDAAERAVSDAGVLDVQAARVPGQPHLRVDRLLASLAIGRPAGRAFNAWLEHATALARQGWAVELANLPAEAHSTLSRGDPAASQARAEACITELASRTIADPAGHDALLAASRVPDAYVDWQRVVGLYPLTRMAVLAGYFGWREALDAVYATPLEALPVAGTLRRYAAPRGAAPPGRWVRDALGYPILDAAQREALFAAHSPLWEIDTLSGDDMPGMLVWRPGEWRAVADSSRPAIYHHLSFSRIAGTILPQLNYLLWFPARSAQREGDIYAGHLDGLLLRVTLDDDGVPLLYDSIHPCGCYHMFFPGPRLRPRPLAEVGGEGYHVPQAAPSLHPGERLAVRIAAGTHQLLRLYAVPLGTPSSSLDVRAYDELRSLPHPRGRRSLFGADGLVDGTARSERYLLWPMGVPSAGAMRQWGNHATAFVGRRHFDDPGLVEGGFEVVPAAE